MAEAVPADSFPDDSNPCQRGTNALFQDAVRAEGLGPFEPHRGEEEIQISGIGRLLVPLLQSIEHKRVQGNGAARRICLRLTDPVPYTGSQHVDLHRSHVEV
jgi:hypothetical protein